MIGPIFKYLFFLECYNCVEIDGPYEYNSDLPNCNFTDATQDATQIKNCEGKFNSSKRHYIL